MKKILISILAVSMVLLTACSTADNTDAAATETAAPSVVATDDAASTSIKVANDSSTYSYIEDKNTDTGFNISNALMTPSNLVVADDNYLYYVKADSDGSTHLYRSDKNGGNETKLIDNCGGNLNLIGGYLVYSGQDLYDVYKYNLSTKETTRIFLGVYDSVYVVKNVIYMSNGIKGIVSCDMNGENYQIVSKSNSYIAGYYNDYLYYSYADKTTGVISLQKVKVGETKSEEVINDSSLTPALVKDGKVLCITTDTETSSYVFEIYSIDQNKITDQVLSFNPNYYGLNSFSMSSGSIYFSFIEEVKDDAAAATNDPSATAEATAPTKKINNLYAYDIASKKTYNLGEIKNVLLMFAGKDMYTIDGDMGSSDIYTNISTLTKLNINGNSVEGKDIFTKSK